MLDTNKQKGFSLVEASVALVIIGLVIGGIVLARSMIRTAEIRVTMAEVTEMKSLVGQFKEFYNGLPGDLRNASDYFNGASNGDGNGQIAAETSDEAFLVFSHLQAAELMDGSHTGAWGGAFSIGSNIQESAAENGTALYMRCCGDNNLDIDNLINVFTVDTSDTTKRAGAFTPVEAFAIDDKIDDGNPDSGFVGANGNWVTSAYVATNCFNSGATPPVYLVDDDSRTCQMLFGYDWD